MAAGHESTSTSTGITDATRRGCFAQLITPRHVVQSFVFDATSFTPRQRGGRWFESTAAHHGFHNAKRFGKAEGRDDTVAALDPDLDNQLLEQRLALTRRSIEHRVADPSCTSRMACLLGASTLVAERRSSSSFARTSVKRRSCAITRLAKRASGSRPFSKAL